MKPLKQRNRHRPAEGVWGDCHRAAVASLLELPMDDVPHFGDGGPDAEEFSRRETEFFRARGMARLVFAYRCSLDELRKVVQAHNPGIYYLLGGVSRNGTPHTVVALGGEIVHDPALDDSGIVGPLEDELYWVTFVAAPVTVAGCGLSAPDDTIPCPGSFCERRLRKPKPGEELTCYCGQRVVG